MQVSTPQDLALLLLLCTGSDLFSPLRSRLLPLSGLLVLAVAALRLLLQVLAVHALLGRRRGRPLAGSRAQGSRFGGSALEDLWIFAGIRGGIEDFEAKS